MSFLKKISEINLLKIIIHFQDHQRKSSLKCEVCNKDPKIDGTVTFSNLKRLEQHCISNHLPDDLQVPKKPPYKCPKPKCTFKSVKSVKNWIYHINSKHYPCEINKCGIMFMSENKLNSHSKIVDVELLVTTVKSNIHYFSPWSPR